MYPHASGQIRLGVLRISVERPQRRLPALRGEDESLAFWTRNQEPVRLEIGGNLHHPLGNAQCSAELPPFQSLIASGFRPRAPFSLSGIETGSISPPSSMNRSCSLRFLCVKRSMYRYANRESRRCRSRSSCSFLRLLCRIEKCFDLILCIQGGEFGKGVVMMVMQWSGCAVKGV